MRCKQASQMMSARLDGRLDSAEIALLEDHLAVCDACQAEWHRMQALDSLLASVPMLEPPLRLRVQVMARLDRKDRARRAVAGGTALVLGSLALALLTLAPAILCLLNATGIGPALISAGPATAAQLLGVLETVGRSLIVLLGTFAIPFAFLGLCGVTLALVLNGLWVGTVRWLCAAR